MNIEKQGIVCVAVLYFKDKRYSEGRKPMCFTNKADFKSFVTFNADKVFHDEVLVVLRGGGHGAYQMEAVLNAEWIMEAA